MKQARDLILLSMLAFKQGKVVESGKLFAAAIASDDIDQFIEVLNEEQTVVAGSLTSSSRAIETYLEEAATVFSASLSEEIEDEVDLVIPAQAEDNDDEDFESSDDVSDMPGETIIPGSLSSELEVDKPLEPSRPKIVLSESLSATIKLKKQ